MSAPFLVEALAGHDRSMFSSGVQALDRYFRIQVTQDVRRRVASCSSVSTIRTHAPDRVVEAFGSAVLPAAAALDHAFLATSSYKATVTNRAAA